MNRQEERERREARDAAILAAGKERDQLLSSIDTRAADLGLELPPGAPCHIPAAIDFDERSTGVVVFSLQGLRRIDSMLEEMQDRRLAERLAGEEAAEENGGQGV